MTPLRFAALGLDHGHILGMTKGMLEAGAECAGYWTDGEPLTMKAYTERYPDIERVAECERLLDDPSVDLVLIATPPYKRAALAIEAMKRGKDVMVDKPGCVSLEELAAIRTCVKETGRIWSVNFSERFQVPAVGVATQMVQEGRIGKVIQMVGMGPHRLRLPSRPDWFFDPKRYGGILIDIASHQIDQFLHFAGVENAEIAHSAVSNVNHPDYPLFEDFGEVNLVSGNAQAYIRVDWFTADALPNWGDGRLFLLGTEGTIEIRKYLDFCGRPGTDHLFLVNNQDYDYFDCSKEKLTYFHNLSQDIRERTERACPQAHSFTVMELAIKAQMQAARRGNLTS
nr:Gfo/Idh/MocA family oxidoreductase [uncultured Cohaesibacter sp.]